VTAGNATAYTTTYASYPDSVDPTPNPAPVEHVVDVGVDGLTYTPAFVQAAVDDVVVFTFHNKNHTGMSCNFDLSDPV
jgi:plastocyanin